VGNAPKRKPTTTKKRPTAPSSTSTTPQRTIPWNRIGAGVGILAAVALAVFIGTSSGGGNASAGAPDGTEFVETGEPTHVEGEVAHPEGDNPAGGPHNPAWLNCGIYSAPVPSENAVHSLEHGAVWITYQGLAEDDIDTLAGIASRRQKMIVSPEPEQTSPIRLTAWNAILEVDSADDSRIVQFVNEFEGSPTNAPEPGGICNGGIGTPGA